MIRIAFFAALCTLSLAAQNRTVVYHCTEGRDIRADYRRATSKTKDSVTVRIAGYPRITLPLATSASGARFTDGFTTFWNKGEEASFYSGELTLKECSTTKLASRIYTGEYVYFADSARFRDCDSGTRYPVAIEAAHIDAERAYLKAGLPPQAPLRIRVEGRLEQRPRMDAPGTETTLVIAKFLDAEKGMSCEVAPVSLEGAWDLTEVNGKTVVAERKPTIEFDGKERRAFGFGGCNRFTGPYTQNGDRLRLGPLAATKMACPGNGMQLEDELFQVFENVAAQRIEGNHLVLTNSDGAVIARFSRK